MIVLNLLITTRSFVFAGAVFVSGKHSALHTIVNLFIHDEIAATLTGAAAVEQDLLKSAIVSLSWMLIELQ